MQAARFYGPGDIRVEQVDRPKAENDRVIVAVEWCGICGSDLSEYSHGPVAIPTKPHPLSGEKLPVTMGHEFSGIISSAPPGSKFSPGQPVMIDPRMNCGKCLQCSSGHTNGCEKWGFLGLSGGGGGLAEMVAVRPEKLHALPESVDLAVATLLEPLSVAWHAATLSGLEKGNCSNAGALVVGGGPVGASMIHVLRAWGMKDIFVSEPSTTRRKWLEDIVEAAFNPMETDVSSECRQRTGGTGVDAVFDCAGSQAALDSAIGSLKFRGSYINVALATPKITLPCQLMLVRELKVTSSLAYNDADFSAVVGAFISGQFNGVEKMVTRKISLQEVVQKGFEHLVHQKDEHMKIVVSPKLQA
ncbi:unnamed protein product [Clonostachys rosea]|uniref:Enoyl reductase (ER) domain-containing protein n=1 Tax=Bionectria ochroleuca TaxID=29856 RepID=A0ABY6TU92_BIOOC|nr:unnamed protein product [Clonostachys rosea]